MSDSERRQFELQELEDRCSSLAIELREANAAKERAEEIQHAEKRILLKEIEDHAATRALLATANERAEKAEISMCAAQGARKGWREPAEKAEARLMMLAEAVRFYGSADNYLDRIQEITPTNHQRLWGTNAVFQDQGKTARAALTPDVTALLAQHKAGQEAIKEVDRLKQQIAELESDRDAIRIVGEMAKQRADLLDAEADGLRALAGSLAEALQDAGEAMDRCCNYSNSPEEDTDGFAASQVQGRIRTALTQPALELARQWRERREKER